MACRLMGCSLIKKVLVGTALGAGALYLAFGTSAPSYVKTAFHKVRHNAKSAVPVQFETLDREISAMKGNLKTEKTAMKTLQNSLDTGDFRLVGSTTYTAEEVKG